MGAHFGMAERLGTISVDLFGGSRVADAGTPTCDWILQTHTVQRLLTLSFEVTPILILSGVSHEFRFQATKAKGHLQCLVHIAEKFQKFGKVHTVIGHHSQVKDHMESSVT
jgi:hypothetical protein